MSYMLRGMAKPLVFSEMMVARFPAGTFDRITTVLNKGENRADFVRVAIEHELQRRARARGSVREGKDNPIRRRRA